MNTSTKDSTARRAAVAGLAVTGFIALVTLGIWSAVYSTRFVPRVVNRIGAAAVYFESVFTSSAGPSLSVVPNASTTIQFGKTVLPSSTAASTTSPTITPPSARADTHAYAGKRATSTELISGTSRSSLSGLPDMVVHIDAIGYLATSSTDSFVASSTVPAGSRPAVRFTIKNIGTNATGTWRFSASIPTSSNSIYQSAPQQNLNPGDYIEYTLGFDQANYGNNKMISVTANFDHAVAESNTSNNSASAQITILGS